MKIIGPACTVLENLFIVKIQNQKIGLFFHAMKP